MENKAIDHAVNVLEVGGIIAYPTEAVFGLGCDPFNARTVLRLLRLKQRKVEKGLILVAAEWKDEIDLVKKIPTERLDEVLASWPGPYTWVFPSSSKTPKWISGEHDTIAIRISAHPVVKSLCKKFAGPLVSTSANIAGNAPAKTPHEVLDQFPHGIDFIVPGKIGRLKAPTEIRDVLTFQPIR